MINIRIASDWSRDSWAIYAFEYTAGEKVQPFKITIERMKPHERHQYMEASLYIKRDQMTEYVEALKRGLAEAGFLADIGPLEGELRATKTHLDDIRRMSGQLLEKILR